MENTQKAYITRCKFCGHEFEYKKHDVKKDFFEDNCEPYFFVECPKCKSESIVYDEEKHSEKPMLTNADVNEIAKMQWKIDRMEEILRRLYFYAKGKESQPLIPITDIPDIDHYTSELMNFIKGHTKTEQK